MEKINGSESQKGFQRKEEGHSILEIVELPPADQEKTLHYLTKLRKYLISGIRTDESLATQPGQELKILYQKAEDTGTDYPVFYDSRNNQLISLYHQLEKLIHEHFDKESSERIQNELLTVYASVKNRMDVDESEKVVQYLMEGINKSHQSKGLSQKEAVDFEAKMDAIQQDLNKQSDNIFSFQGKTALHLLNLHHRQRDDLKSQFLKALEEVIIGLKELLILHGDSVAQSGVKLDFADDLISFEKIEDISVSAVSSQLPESRLFRLKTALQTLSKAKKFYAQSNTTIFTSKALVKTFDLEHIFDNAHIKVVVENTCQQANIQSRKELDEFVQTIAALRVGKLMMDQKYDEALHDHYFDQFNLAYLSDDDLKYLHAIIVIEDSRALMRQSNDLLTALSRNSFVKILGMNFLDDLYRSCDQDETEYLELSSLAIFRRCGYVYQGGIECPSILYESYRKGLYFAGPAFWNILMPSGVGQRDYSEYTAVNAAIESRYFPRMEYESDDKHFAVNQISLEENSDPESDFIIYPQKIKTPSGIDVYKLSFTMAEFLAMDSTLKTSLEIIPPMYRSTNIIPLDEYLAHPMDSLSGKIPFIWLVDDQNQLSKAAIPVLWIQICRSRLDYWHFLQSISGINKVHMQETIEALQSEWDATKKTEIEALTTSLNEKYEKEKSGALKEAVTKMLYGLLNQGNNIESHLTKISTAEIKPDVAVIQEAENKQEATPAHQTVAKEKEETITVVSKEAWVESDECTSCKDCIAALPAVFAYNENKQAYVHNPKGGAFAEIVKLAEKCPARCIHPGIPQNKNEASLDKWIERAEKYN